MRFFKTRLRKGDAISKISADDLNKVYTILENLRGVGCSVYKDENGLDWQIIVDGHSSDIPIDDDVDQSGESGEPGEPGEPVNINGDADVESPVARTITKLEDDSLSFYNFLSGEVEAIQEDDLTQEVVLVRRVKNHIPTLHYVAIKRKPEESKKPDVVVGTVTEIVGGIVRVRIPGVSGTSELMFTEISADQYIPVGSRVLCHLANIRLIGGTER